VGTWEENNQLSDGEVFDAAGATLRWERLLSEQVVKRVELDVFYGGRIIIEAESALLQLEGEGEEFERWSGPL
jgi:hypothetical protein